MLRGQLFFLLSVLLLASFQKVLAFPRGAPSGVCNSMTPFHLLYGSSRNASPFGISTDSNVVKALRTSDVVGGRAFNTVAPSIKVTIVSLDGTDEFKGFLLQARDSSGNAIGSFTIPSGSFSKTLDCSGGSNSAVTHSSNNKRSSESFYWSPNLDYQGQVHFVATVVEGFRTFYTDIQSLPVTVVV